MKLCTEAVSIDEVLEAIDIQLSIGKDRDWTFRSCQYTPFER